MYQVSERVKKQFEYTMSIPCVKEAMKFIQEDERNTIEEQKELVLIEASDGGGRKTRSVMMEKFKALGLENVHIDRGGNVVWPSKRKRQRTEGIDRGSSGYSLSIWNGTWCRGERRIPLRTGESVMIQEHWQCCWDF